MTPPDRDTTPDRDTVEAVDGEAQTASSADDVWAAYIASTAEGRRHVWFTDPREPATFGASAWGGSSDPGLSGDIE